MSKERQRARAAQQGRRDAGRRPQGSRAISGEAGRGQQPPPPGGKGRPAGKGQPGGKGQPTRGQAGRKDQRPPVYRQRRFPPLPLWLKAALVVLWLLVQVAAYFLLDSWGPRLAVLIVSTLALPVVVVLVRNPARRYRR